MKNKYSLSVIGILLILAMLCSFLALPVSAAAEAEAAALAKIDPALLEKMETASPDEKIPVAIWYTDIDQEKVDKLTVDKVGFTQDDIAVTYEMPSTKLISDLEKGEDGAADEMQAYLKRTEAKREKERKRTNEYIMTRREFSREKYNEKSSYISEQLNINKNDVMFKSEYAPLVEMNATNSFIKNISKNSNVLSIEYIPIEDENVITHPTATDTTPELSTLEKMQSTINYTDVITNLNLSGKNIKIGMFESGGNITFGNTEVPRNQFITVGAVEESGHVDNTASILIGSVNGFAKDSVVYSTNSTKQYIEAMITAYEIKIMNVSFGDNSYTKWVNHLVAHHNITIVAAAGNIPQSDIYVISPATASNVIAVGAYDISNTVDPDDDILCDYSAYEEIANGISKPDVIMPANVLGEGTSSSAPVLAACIALMFELKPSLAMHPQAVKAIILASCHRKVNPSTDNETAETMLQGITERQGAGAPDIWKIACIVSNGTYGIGTINPQKTIGTRRFVLPAYGSSYANISIAWLNENKHGSDFSSSNIEDITDGEDANLNLSVYRHGSVLKSSNLNHSSTEMVYFQLNSYTDYELRITKASTCEEPVRYGYAYCLDNPYISRVSDDGIYYLRNYCYDTYLTLDPSTGNTSLQSFTGADTQKWILQKSSDVSFKLISGYGNAGMEKSAISLGTNIVGSTYNATTQLFDNNNSMLDMDFQLLSNSSGLDMKDGAVAFFYPDPNKQSNNYILTCQSGAGAFSKCSMNDNINVYRSWVLENVNYRQGDSNMDGNFTVKDATLIEKYIANLSTLNNQQMFLADVNCDSVVNIKDSTLINKILTKQAIY